MKWLPVSHPDQYEDGSIEAVFKTGPSFVISPVRGGYKVVAFRWSNRLRSRKTLSDLGVFSDLASAKGAAESRRAWKKNPKAPKSFRLSAASPHRSWPSGGSSPKLGKMKKAPSKKLNPADYAPRAPIKPLRSWDGYSVFGGEYRVYKSPDGKASVQTKKSGAHLFVGGKGYGPWKTPTAAIKAYEDGTFVPGSGGSRNNPSRGPWKSMADVRAASAASGGYFFKNKTRRGSEMERESPTKGPYNGRYIVVPKQTQLSSGWSKQAAIYRVEDDGRIRHVETLWGPYSWENAIEMAKGMVG